jgi:D-alanyl-D-alanine carboxypeptidase
MAKGEVNIDGNNYHFTSAGKRIILVNPWNPVPEDYVLDLVKLGTAYATDGNNVQTECEEALKEMIKACNKASGHRVCVISSYRTLEHQQKLFKKQVDKNLKKGYSQEEAERLAAQVVAVPGTSEHHSGLAVDIIDSCCSWDLDEVQAGLPGQQWLMEHSWEYGFILRYPEGTTDSTGIIYEPWHYRYVGKELAKELHDLGLTLEEYMTMLTEAEQ